MHNGHTTPGKQRRKGSAHVMREQIPANLTQFQTRVQMCSALITRLPEREPLGCSEDPLLPLTTCRATDRHRPCTIVNTCATLSPVLALE